MCAGHRARHWRSTREVRFGSCPTGVHKHSPLEQVIKDCLLFLTLNFKSNLLHYTITSNLTASISASGHPLTF